MSQQDSSSIVQIPARAIPIPAHLSPVARAYLTPLPTWGEYPALEDKAGWSAYVAAVNEGILSRFPAWSEATGAQVEQRDAGGAEVFDITPTTLESGDRTVILEMHGGALILCGGEMCRIMGIGTAMRLGRRVWAVDYRMPPEHPYPAALDDCLAAYRALLEERLPSEIIVSGGSAGGNLAAALMLRARDEGLPMPAGLILGTPEIDLTRIRRQFPDQ